MQINQYVPQQVANLIKLLQAKQIDTRVWESQQFKVIIYSLDTNLLEKESALPITMFNFGLSIVNDNIVPVMPYEIPKQIVMVLSQNGMKTIPFSYFDGHYKHILFKILTNDNANWYMLLKSDYAPFQFVTDVTNIDTITFSAYNFTAKIMPDTITIANVDIPISKNYKNYMKLVHTYELLRILSLQNMGKFFIAKTDNVEISRTSGSFTWSDYFLVHPRYISVLPIKNLVRVGNVFVDGNKFARLIQQLGLQQLHPETWPISFVIPVESGYYSTAKVIIKVNKALDEKKVVPDDEIAFVLQGQEPPLWPSSYDTKHYPEYGITVKRYYTSETVLEFHGKKYSFYGTNSETYYKVLKKVVELMA